MSDAIKILLAMKTDKCTEIDLNVYKEIIDLAKKEHLFYCENSIYYDDNFIFREFSFEEIMKFNNVDNNTLNYSKDKLDSWRKFIPDPTENNEANVLTDQTRPVSKLLSLKSSMGISKENFSQLSDRERNHKTFDTNQHDIESETFYRGGINVVIDYTIALYKLSTKINNLNYESIKCTTITRKKSPIKISKEIKKYKFCYC